MKETGSGPEGLPEEEVPEDMETEEVHHSADEYIPSDLEDVIPPSTPTSHPIPAR